MVLGCIHFAVVKRRCCVRHRPASVISIRNRLAPPLSFWQCIPWQLNRIPTIWNIRLIPVWRSVPVCLSWTARLPSAVLATVPIWFCPLVMRSAGVRFGVSCRFSLTHLVLLNIIGLLLCRYLGFIVMLVVPVVAAVRSRISLALRL